MRYTTALAVTAAVVGGMLLAPGPAHAADQDFYVTASAEGIQIDVVRGQFMNPVVHLRVKGSNTRVQTIKDFKYEDSDSSSTEGSFTSGPVKLDKLGLYDVDVEYRGTEGESLVRKDTATLPYTLKPVLSGITSSKAVSLDSLGTTVEADLQGLDPRDGKQTPLANAEVAVWVAEKPFTATTDGKGHVKAPITFTGTEASAQVQVGHKTAAGLSVWAKADVRVSAQAVKIELDPGSRAVSVPENGTVPVKGSIKRVAADGTLKPVATPMSLHVLRYPYKFKSTADGRFSTSFRADDDRTAEVTTDRQIWLDQKTSASLVADVPADVHFPGQPTEQYGPGVPWTVRFNQYATLYHTTVHSGPKLPTGGPVEIQFSTDGKAWTTRQTFVTTFETRFDQSVPAERGYWRLRYAGKDVPHGSSDVLKVDRVVPAISEFNAHPEPVKRGGQLTVEGRVNGMNSPATPVARATVAILYRPTSTSAWVKVGTTATDARGAFKKAFIVDRSGDWMAVTSRDAWGLRAESRVDSVEVTG
ncbi:hypothetical protein ACIA8F_35120 [Streptomyces sp. NPDC051563]|uniref:hypothetical protein n=1 Tax=Streptomyces sp. NPDC051563 TaxID=3365659 RepID=UPI0037A70CF9